MGYALSKLLSSSVGSFDSLLSEIANLARNSRTAEGLVFSDEFWGLVHNLASNATAQIEFRGYISALLREDWRTSVMLFDLIAPANLSMTSKRFIISVMKLELVSRAMQSEALWRMAFDRVFVTAIYNIANGYQLTPQQKERISAPLGSIPLDQGTSPASSSSSSSSTSSSSTTTAASTPPPVASIPLSPPPPPLARFFTILSLPAVRELLIDISKGDDVSNTDVDPWNYNANATAPSLEHTNQTTSTKAINSSNKRGEKLSSKSTPSALPTAPPPPPVDHNKIYKSTLILLLNKDLLRLSHILDRERGALESPLPRDPGQTELGFERKWYIVLRGVVKFLIAGSENGNSQSNSMFSSSSSSMSVSPSSPTPSAVPPIVFHPTSTPTNLSYFSRLLLDEEFQQIFLSKEFLSEIFGKKFNYYMQKMPSLVDMREVESTDKHPVEWDRQLCSSIGNFGRYFLELFSDTHVELFLKLMQKYNKLFIENFLQIVYIDIILPLFRPDQYVRMMLKQQSPASSSSSASIKDKNKSHNNSNNNGNGNGNNNGSQSSSNIGAAASNGAPSSRTKNHSTPSLSPASATISPPSPSNFPALLPFPPIPTLPFTLSSHVVIAIAFLYHWCFEPVSQEILQAAVENLKGYKLKSGKQGNSGNSSGNNPISLSIPFTHLRDPLLQINFYRELAAACVRASSTFVPLSSAATAAAASSGGFGIGASVCSHLTPNFNRIIHSVTTTPALTSLFQYLQIYTPHIAFCLAQALDEVNVLWKQEEEEDGEEELAGSGNFNMFKTPSSSPSSSSSAKTQHDMFEPRLSYTAPDNNQQQQQQEINNLANTTYTLSNNSSSVPVSPASTKPGVFASVFNWFRPSSPSASHSPANHTIPPALRGSHSSSSPLPPQPQYTYLSSLNPQLICPRSTFSIWTQRQARIWCTRVMEGRGFSKFIKIQQAIPGNILPSQVWVQQPQYEGRKRFPRKVGGATSSGQWWEESSGNGGGGGSGSSIRDVDELLSTISSSTGAGSQQDPIFYVELLLFLPEFVERLVAFAYVYEWTDQYDELVRKKRKLKAIQASSLPQHQQQKLPSSTSASFDSKPLPSPQYHLVLSNMSRAKSTPFDLGPLRGREYIAIICNGLSSLLQENKISYFLSKSENFWSLITDTRWWDLIAVATMIPRENSSSGGEQSQKLSAGAASTASPLHLLLTLLSSPPTSSHHLLLVELGARGQFYEIFNPENINQVLGILRLVGSWDVQNKMKAREEKIARRNQRRLEKKKKASFTATASSSSSAASTSSRDYYSLLTAPFTFWGIVHSLSVVDKLRAQYIGALHWFLSKRNMEMQIEIWRLVKSVVYGDQQQTGRDEPVENLQKLRLQRLHQITLISQSVNSSGIIQAIFTFPLATAHFYATVGSRILWSQSREEEEEEEEEDDDEEGEAGSAVATASSSSSPSTTSLLLTHFYSLLYTLSTASSEHSYLHIPHVRMTVMEWWQRVLQEVEERGSGAKKWKKQLEAQQREESRRAMREKRKNVQQEEKERLKQIIEAEKEARLESSKAKNKNKSKSSSNNKTIVTTTTLSPSADFDMFSASKSYRSHSGVEEAPILPTTIIMPSGKTQVPTTTATAAGAIGTFSSISPVLLRVQSEVNKLFPTSPTTPSIATSIANTISNTGSSSVTAPTSPSTSPSTSSSSDPSSSSASIPARFTRRDDGAYVDPDEDANVSTSSDSVVQQDSVTLPPPFEFEKNQKEKSSDNNKGQTETKPSSPSSSTASPVRSESDIAAEKLARSAFPASAPFSASSSPSSHTITSTAGSLVPPSSSATTATATPPSSSSSSAIPVVPLPQRHRLLYSFFQLLLSQSFLKLLLSSNSFFEMLADVSFLEICTSLVFGSINGAGERSNEINGSNSSSGGAGLRHQLKHTSQLIQRKRAQLRLVQKLLGHYRFQILMEELKKKQFEKHLEEMMKNILIFLNGENGKALIAAIMEGLNKREKGGKKKGGGVSESRRRKQVKESSSSSSISHRFHSLTLLLSHPSTHRLLTSPAFWLLFADPLTLQYFSNGQYLRLWLYQQKNLSSMRVVKILANAAVNKAVETVSNRVGGGGGSAAVEENQASQQQQQEREKLSRREKMKGFVKKTISNATEKVGKKNQLQQQQQRSFDSKSSPSSPPSDDPSNNSNRYDPSTSPPPLSLVAIRHFVSLVQTIYELLVGKNVNVQQLQAQL